jgi:hypothetical protein
LGFKSKAADSSSKKTSKEKAKDKEYFLRSEKPDVYDNVWVKH